MTERTLLSILFLVTGLGLACGGHDAAIGDGQPEASVRALLSQAERVEIPQSIEVRGTVEAASLATVSTRVMATVTAIHVAAGDHVETGDLLLEIDPQAAHGQVAQARGALAQAEAALTLAARNNERFQALAATQAASALEAEMAHMRHEQARGAVEQARGAVEAASSVATDARVTAPFSGRIARRLVEIGDLAAPGRPLFLVESAGARRLVLAVPESVMNRARLALGDPLAVRIDSRPELGELTGIVIETTPGADPSTHSFEARLTLPLVGLTTGAAGRAWIEVGRRSAIVVPTAAVVRQGGLELVVVRTDDNRTSTRAVTTGARLADGRLEILSGLTGTETVLLGLGSVPPAGSPVDEGAR